MEGVDSRNPFRIDGIDGIEERGRVIDAPLIPDGRRGFVRRDGDMDIDGLRQDFSRLEQRLLLSASGSVGR